MVKFNLREARYKMSVDAHPRTHGPRFRSPHSTQLPARDQPHGARMMHPCATAARTGPSRPAGAKTLHDRRTGATAVVPRRPSTSCHPLVRAPRQDVASATAHWQPGDLASQRGAARAPRRLPCGCLPPLGPMPKLMQLATLAPKIFLGRAPARHPHP